MKKYLNTVFIGLCVLAGIVAGLGAANFYAVREPAPVAVISPEPDIVIIQPVPGAQVSSPIRITGYARGSWFFENSFPVRLMDKNDAILDAVPATASSDWMTANFVPFEALMRLTVATDTNLVLAFHNDNASGLPQYDKEYRMPIILKGVGTSSVYVFWSNEKLNPNMRDCAKVFPSKHFIAKTASVARVALEQLLAGPYFFESQQGFSTAMNQGVKIQSLTIENGVAKVDFDKTLEQGVGGSCRVAAIRAQITKTLMQFPTVKTVVISIDNRAQDILQP